VIAPFPESATWSQFEAAPATPGEGEGDGEGDGVITTQCEGDGAGGVVVVPLVTRVVVALVAGAVEAPLLEELDEPLPQPKATTASPNETRKAPDAYALMEVSGAQASNELAIA
jgi:hypothetical protein